MGGSGAGALHAVRVVAVSVPVRKAAAARRRVRVSSGATQVAGALARVRVAPGAAAGASLHRAAVRVALRHSVTRRPLRRARVRVRVLLGGAPRQRVPVHHHVVTRRLQQPRAVVAARFAPTLAPDPTQQNTNERKRSTMRYYE